MWPSIYQMHPGGIFSGKLVRGMSLVVDCFEDCGTVYVSVEYRLAPEHPAALKKYYGAKMGVRETQEPWDRSRAVC